MKKMIFLKSFALLFCLGLLPRLSAQPQMVLLPEEAETARRVVWSTEPGIRYVLQVSDDLSDPLGWQDVEGFPSEATALAQQHAIESSLAGPVFFRVVEMDEQPPQVTQRFPADGGFGIRRFGTITVDLADATGIDPGSVILTVGTHGSFTLEDTQLTWEEPTLSFSLGGDTALGGLGDEVQVELVVADLLGNLSTLVWSFELETEPEVVENLFVFGCPDAQRAGQRLEGAAAALAARFHGGPVRMNDPDNYWTLQEVTETHILLGYEGTPPDFAVGQKLANLAPASEAEIFYRQITEITHKAGENTILLATDEISLADLISGGAFSLPENPILLELDENGTLQRSLELSGTLNLPPLGADLSGAKLFRIGTDGIQIPDDQAWADGFEGELALSMHMVEARFMFYPSLHTALRFDLLGLNRYEVAMRGRLETACVPSITVSATLNRGLDKVLWRHSHWLYFQAGPVPVAVEIKMQIKTEALLELEAAGTISGGGRQNMHMEVGGVYQRGASPVVSWNRNTRVDPFQRVPFSYEIEGSAGARLALIPQVDVRVYGVAGLYLNVDPRVEISGNATWSGGSQVQAGWALGAYADLNAGLSVVGIATSVLPALPPFRLFTFEWSDSFDAAPPPTVPITITRQPLSQNARAGDAVRFTVDASGPPNLQFQWYQNGLMLAGRTQRHLDLANVNAGHAGQYHARVRDAAGQSVNSNPAQLTLTTSLNTGPAPAGMVRIPAGWFTMGRTSGDTDSDAPPVNVYVSEFYMARHQVTWALWNDVRNWAFNHGYTDIGEGGGKGADHPVHSVSWWDAVKWLNARSEREGLTPVYRNANGTVFKTGTTAPTANWNANGYRLPTEAEWEKAARGGVSGQRFPWGNEINHSNANYRANGRGYTYDTSPYTTWTFHPTYNDGTWPYTSPVGSFQANGYGLYDMIGNVWEWCWDWYSASTYTDGATDPKGESSGSYRVFRGGSWNFGAIHGRSAGRHRINPADRYNSVGFRPARSSVP